MICLLYTSCVRTGQQQEALSNLTGLIKSYAALADKKNDYICASVAELIYDIQNDMEKTSHKREYEPVSYTHLLFLISNWYNKNTIKNGGIKK